MVLLNFERRIVTTESLTKDLGVASYTLYCIRDGKTYKDYKLEYDNLSDKEKEKIVSLLSN